MNRNLLLLISSIAFLGCGASDTSVKKIDIVNYLPSTSMSKEYTHVTKIDGNLNNRAYTDSVVVESNLVSIKTDGNPNKMITVKADEIEIKYVNDLNHSKVITRNFNRGDTISNYLKADELEILKIGSQKIGEKRTKIEEKCMFDSIVERYEKFFFEYTNYDGAHDIMKIKCITKTVVDTKIDAEYVDSVSYTNGVVESKDDISYVYLQKGLGMIATINDDCLASKLPDVIDDTLPPEKCLGERYEYDLYQPQY